MSFFRRLGILVLFCLLGNPLSLTVIGIVNRMTGCVGSVFLLYPASSRYTQAFAFDWFAKQIYWSPVLLGVFRQNGKIGLTFAISATERDLLNSANTVRLARIHEQMELIRRRVGGEQKTFAGILPGIMVSRGILSANPPENRATVVAVQRALNLMRKEAALAEDTPLVILGAFGFVGKELMKALPDVTHAPLFAIDLHNRDNFEQVVEKLKGKPAIVVNLSKKGALKEYARHFWPGVAVLNEVYPEPGKEELRLITAAGASCWHLVGVRGESWPPFPNAYRGGIPCCASWLPGEEDGEYDVIIERKV